MQGCIRNQKKISWKASEKKPNNSVFACASECAENLLDEGALSEEAKAELNRFKVASLCVNSMNLFC